MARQRKRKGDPISGWLNLFKPVDMTSTQAVAILKRKFNAQKVGHGGTLDPLADGILPIAFGEATKTVQWAMDAEKEYVFTIRWGVSTESQDAEGEVTATSDTRPTREQVEELLKDYLGTIEQVPPKFSAIKVDGQRAYDLARDGEEFELTSREVQVYEAAVIGMPDADHTVIHVTSGKGFYVRAMARDLACDLGCEGHISQLRRTRVGVFGAPQAVALSRIEETEDKEELLSLLQPVHAILEDIPQIDISCDEAREIRQGRAIVLLPHIVEQWREAAAGAEEYDRGAIAICSGQAVALGDVRAGRFEPSRVFVN
ncbi:MAG: tRNA pseudouridine(55) synthase TruB [Alphaproteobacteria bacterium]|nr:tRNA pseudouridine(55) synthase TruB [Hyphomonas sp.]MBR9808281.1 tRNA pseudouridine(55) synthase TruB [Alphaproteobacteria bacterium]